MNLVERVALPYRGAYDWSAMLAWLGSRAIPGVEGVSGDGRYVRSIELENVAATISVEPDGAAGQLVVAIDSAETSQYATIVERLRRLFDLDADLETINAHLSADARLAAHVARRAGLRVPGAWDGYELAVRAVLGQQISVAGASKLAGRLVERFGTPLPAPLRNEETQVLRCFPKPEVLAEADVAALGMPRARADAIRTVARVAAGNPRFFEPARDLTGSLERLRRLPGIGEWTANYVAMRALRESDAFPAADIGLQRALANSDGNRPSAREIEALAQAWSPWRAYAAVHLWAADAERTALASGT